MTDPEETKNPRAGRRSRSRKESERGNSDPERAAPVPREGEPSSRIQADAPAADPHADKTAPDRMTSGAHGWPTSPAITTIPPEPAADTERPKQAFFTIAEVAVLLQMSERTIRRRIEDGTIRKAPLPGRLVRISVEELARLGGRNPLPDSSND